MKVSVNELKRFTDVNLSIDELVQKIGSQLGEVEAVEDLGKKYEGIVVAKIISCTQHPNADKLKLCLIDDGKANKHTDRNPSGLVQVVCGAPNVKAGMLVAWLPPGVTVPASYDTEPLILEAREIRGQISSGMLASPKELAINDNHSLILELGHIPIANSQLPQPGDDFARLLGLDDYIIEIENKMFTHRPDLFGMLGIARELAGIQDLKFQSPDWYLKPESSVKSQVSSKELSLQVNNEIPKLVPRFMAVAMSGVKVAPSPLWLQLFLSKMGMKPINNIVDYTNFFMLETGQPLHAYDYDKLEKSGKQKAVSIETRKSRKGDKLKLLNGKQVILKDDSDILITSGDKPIGFGGVMGGSETEVDSSTKNIILECANFNMYSIRRTSMTHGLFTDAVTRFTKGQSPLQNPAVLAKIVEEIERHAGGKVASRVIDDKHLKDEPLTQKLSEATPINQRLGTELNLKDIQQMLENVEFQVLASERNGLLIKPPFWRTDIEITEDIAEEIGRLHGYDRLPQVLPQRSLAPAKPNALLDFKHTIRQQLQRQGANEALTHSFVHGDLLQKAGQDKTQAYTVANALSPALQYYRLSLLPSLLEAVHPNSKAGYDEFALFELGKTHSVSKTDENGLPEELDSLAMVIASTNSNGAAFYSAKRQLEALAKSFGLELNFYPVERDPDLPLLQPFAFSRSAFVAVKNSKGMLGVVGELKPRVGRQLKLPADTCGFEIGVAELLEQSRLQASMYQKLSRFPGTWQDICVQVEPKTTYKQVYSAVYDGIGSTELTTKIEPVDIYQPDSKSYKNITLRIHIGSFEGTVTSKAAKEVMENVVKHVTDTLKAKII